MTTGDLIRLALLALIALGLVVLLWILPASGAEDPWSVVPREDNPWIVVQVTAEVAPGWWVYDGEPEAMTEPCATCPSGRRFSGLTGRWLRWSKRSVRAYQIENDQGVMGWWIYDGERPHWVPR